MVSLRISWDAITKKGPYNGTCDPKGFTSLPPSSQGPLPHFWHDICTSWSHGVHGIRGDFFRVGGAQRVEQGNRVEDVRVEKICFFYPRRWKLCFFQTKKSHVSVIKLRKFHKTSDIFFLAKNIWEYQVEPFLMDDCLFSSPKPSIGSWPLVPPFLDGTCEVLGLWWLQSTCWGGRWSGWMLEKKG